MSKLRGTASHLLVRLYPEAWRARYQAEIDALIDDDPPRLRGLTSLVTGAVDAHLRPQGSWRASASPLAQMRLSIGGMFCCWIALSVVGIGFQKETEEKAFFTAGDHHPLLAIAHDAVVAGALLGAVAIAAGGLPLVWEAIRQARTQRGKRLLVVLLLPAAAIVCFGGLTGLLVAIAPSGMGHTSIPIALGILGPWWLGGLACAVTCAIAPRLVLARVTVSGRSMRRASRASLALAPAMVVITVGLIGYALSLAVLAPRLAAESGGPIWPSTGVVLGVGAILATITTALALVSASHSRQALAKKA